MLKKFYNTAIAALLLTLLLSCGLASNDYPTFPKQTGPSTWEYPNNSGSGSGANNVRTKNEGTWYEIFTCSYYDSNGDGIGDIKGITSKLNYLNDGANGSPCKDVNCVKSLHIDGIWLTPIMPSPSYHKYDTTDYMNVDKDFGTIDDVKELVKECHRRGIKLIVDLAVNHTSPLHPWFKAALDEYKKGSLDQFYKYYNFHTSTNKYADVWNEFHDISGHWYRPDEIGLPEATTSDGQYIFYYGAFGKEMPDLNWDNNIVKQEFEKIVSFWLEEVDVDGFRLDATKHVFEVAEWTGNTEKNIAFWTWFADTCRKYKTGAYLVGECLDSEQTILQYHRPGMSSFALFMAQQSGRIANAALMNVNNGDRGNGSLFSDGVLWYAREVKNMNPLATFSPFISNHDFDRSAQYLTMDEERKMAAAMLLLIPGTPFIYYGEEIGLNGWKDNSDKFVRGPMLFSMTDPAGRPKPPDGWELGYGADPDPYNGFSGQGMPAWLARGAAAEQLANPDSLLRYYITVGNLKKKYPWIAYGKTDDNGIVKDSIGQVAAFRVTDDDPQSATFGKSVIIAHNTSREERMEAQGQDWRSGYIKTPNVKGYEAISAHGSSTPVKQIVDPDDLSSVAFWIEPYATVIFREYDGEPK